MLPLVLLLSCTEYLFLCYRFPYRGCLLELFFFRWDILGRVLKLKVHTAAAAAARIARG